MLIINKQQNVTIMGLGLIIQLISGVVGGNLAGSLMKGSSLGTLWNSVVGIVGGGLGGTLLSMISQEMGDAAASNGMDIGSIVSSVAGGGVGGGVLLAIVGMIKKAMAK
ncbi:MAG: putative membrane protein YeaQ/YmgE (transglycosylase-associated protein family) [Paraglaciecola sp.]